MGKIDKRDKRYYAPRRRRKLPWFVVACIATLVGFKWVSARMMLSGHGGAQAHRTDGGAGAGQSNDW